MEAAAEPKLMKLGKLAFPEVAHSIAKETQVMVFNGSYVLSSGNKRSVTIKRFHKDLAAVPTKKLYELQHPNIVRHYAVEEDENFFYVATECYLLTLEMYALGAYQGESPGEDKEVLEQVSRGLHYLHKLKIVHGNICPESIVICPSEMTMDDLRPKPKVKLANFEIDGGTVGWIAPEYALYPDVLTAPSDVFSLGLVFAFLLSKGTHPFGAPHVRQSNILFGSYHLSEEKLNDPSAVDLIKRMLDPDSDSRITIEGVLEHPYFWGGDRALTFVIRVVDEIIKPEMKKIENGEQSPILEELTKDERPIVRGYWKEYLTPCVRKLMDRKSYDARTLTGLLLAIRDKAVLYADQSADVKAEFGSKPDFYWIYWSVRFPMLLVHVWRILGPRLGLKAQAATTKKD